MNVNDCHGENSAQQPSQPDGARLPCILLISAVCLLLIACQPAPPEPRVPGELALELVKEWVDGRYHNLAQAEADMAQDLPPNLAHRPMHQLFARVEVPDINGYILFQQSSADGSEDPGLIFRHGLMQYFIDPVSGVLRQRELYFLDTESFKNAHRNPSILRDVTLADVTWDEGCDFYLEANAERTQVSGPLLEGRCVQFNPGTQSDMYAEDRVEITASEYRFLGRYVDADGQVMWGTESEELNRLVKQ